jgi:hypothetical protein
MSKKTVHPILRAVHRLGGVVRRRNNIPRLSESSFVVCKVLEDIQSARVDLAGLCDCVRSFLKGRNARNESCVVWFQENQAVSVAALPELVYAAAREDSGKGRRVQFSGIMESSRVSGVGTILGKQDGDFGVAVPDDLLLPKVSVRRAYSETDHEWSYKAIEAIQAFAEISIRCKTTALWTVSQLASSA